MGGAVTSQAGARLLPVFLSLCFCLSRCLCLTLLFFIRLCASLVQQCVHCEGLCVPVSVSLWLEGGGGAM